jgi:hypothetical protein
LKRFHFALQPLLEARERARSEARANVLEAAAAHARDRAAVERLRAEFARDARGFVATAFERPPGAVRDAFVRTELHVAALARAQALARRSEEREATARAAFAAARRRCRQIEALRERARGDFLTELERQSEAALDEANAARHNAATLLASSFHN